MPPTAAEFAPVKESPSAEWEVRPCGMVVQTAHAAASSAVAAANVPPVSNIRVKVKHGAARLDIYISSQASFGELKKALSAKTGLHPLDMKLIYKDRLRPSTAFLDVAGVRDKSTVVLEEDPPARAKRLLEMRKAATMEKAAKSVSAIAVEVDRLAAKVSALEAIADNDADNLTESLMNELVKLDAIAGDGDAKSDRRLLIERVRKLVETLDSIKLKNKNNSIEQLHKPLAAPVVMTMNWETFDSLATLSVSSTTTTTTIAAAAAAATSSALPAPDASLNWELF